MADLAVSYSPAGGAVPSDLLNYRLVRSTPGNGDATMQMSATLTSSDGALTVTCGPVSANGYSLQ